MSPQKDRTKNPLNNAEMDKKDLRIVYMGTPEFAVEALDQLVSHDYNVVGVVTMPDKPGGRGQKLRFSPVKEYALAHNLPLMQPTSLKDESFLSELGRLKADLQIVVAFRMLPQVVWGMPRLGTFNLHASLLPKYRGAAPINWAIINGETETGLTTFFLEQGMDTGKVIRQVRMPISETDDVGTLHDRLMVEGGKLVLATVDAILCGEARPVSQSELAPETTPTPAPKIFKETCQIDWTLPGKRVYDLIRGLSPYPAARTSIPNQKGEAVELKVYASRFVPSPAVDVAAGTWHTDGKRYMRFAVPDGYVELLSVQQPGKRRMDIEDFLRGFTPSAHE